MKRLCVLLAAVVSAGCVSSSQPVAKATPKPASAPATAPARAAAPVTVPAPVEMLVNGDFANGDANWVFEQNAPATGQAECVKEGPGGKNAMRIKVLTISDAAWQLQLYQKDLRVEKDREYVLTFWAKSDRDGDITVNCMQNHEPWDHETAKMVSLSTEWKQMQFAFTAPWTDDNVRICFTNLGTVAGQVYWFAGCSLVTAPGAKPVAAPVAAPAPAPAPAKLVLPTAVQAAPAAHRIVVWDGEQATKSANWAHKNCTIAPQTAEAHSGDTAVEFKFQGTAPEWMGAGWNWCAFQTGPYGTDITGMKNFTFWVKKKGTVADLQINLLCNGKEFDMPEHHTEKVSVYKYCPQLADGQWHFVSIPLADLPQPKGFDPLHVGELQMFNAGAGDGSYFFDDLAFDDGTVTNEKK